MPAAGAVGRSLSECTATSTSPRSSASRSALTKTPVPPIDASGAADTSPSVLTSTSSTSRPVAAWKASATWPHWVRASAEPRVPKRTVVTDAHTPSARVTASTASGSSANSSARAAA